MSAGAQDTAPTGARLVDLGPEEATEDPTGIQLIDLGLVAPAATADHAPPGPPGPIATSAVPAAIEIPASDDRPAETWLVEVGDHLWSIAAETVLERDGTTDEAAVARYWRRLIDENRTVIGADADIIHPGLVLTLPA